VGKGTTSRVMVAISPKVSFWPDGSTSPADYRWLFVDSFCSARSGHHICYHIHTPTAALCLWECSGHSDVMAGLIFSHRAFKC
jgi:hypothetical protein